MADPVYLSLWVDAYSQEAMLPLWAKALAEFPVSSLKPGIRELVVYPFEWGETPVLEQSFDEGAGVSHAVALAAEFLHEDYAYEVELNWDVWAPREEGVLDQWERTAQTVAVACLGPRFEGAELANHGAGAVEAEDHPHLLLSLGLDSLFIPQEPASMEEAELLAEALEGVAGNCYRENISQLLAFVSKVEKNIPIRRRLLWSSSGEEDLAERIRAAFE
jgi:hypothetical protein